MEKKLQKIYLSCYNLLIAQDLWQVHYQILSIIFLKEFIELNINSDTVIKNMKHLELNISIATIFWNMQIKSLIHTNKTLIHTNLLTMITISLFYCCKKVFIFMNRWIIGKNSMKLYCLKKSLKYERYY